MDERTRIAVDIGGTFTDVVLERGERRFTAKILTTPHAPDEAVITGVGDVLAASGVPAAEVSLVVHGTTLATTKTTLKANPIITFVGVSYKF